MQVDHTFCEKIGSGIFKTLKIFLLKVCIDDLKLPLDNYVVSKMSDEEMLDNIEKFQEPYLGACNKLIKRFITKRAGVGPKECPQYEQIVNDLLIILDNTTKALEILITCICSIIGCLREINFRFYMNYINFKLQKGAEEVPKTMGAEILMEFNKFLSSEPIEVALIAMLGRKVLEVYSKDTKFEIPKYNIQNSKFINLEVNREGALAAIQKSRETTNNEKNGIPSTLKTGYTM